MVLPHCLSAIHPGQLLTAPSTTPVPTPYQKKHPPPLQSQLKNRRLSLQPPTYVPIVDEETPEEVVFNFHDPDRKSILPGKVCDHVPRSEYRGRCDRPPGGMFHILYNVLYDYPPTRADIGYARSADGIKWEQVSEGSVFSADNVALCRQCRPGLRYDRGRRRHLRALLPHHFQYTVQGRFPHRAGNRPKPGRPLAGRPGTRPDPC